jgi:hypothetical protein
LRWGEGHLDVIQQRRLVVFDKDQIVAPSIDHLLAEVALAEHGVASHQSPFEGQAFEQPKGCLVLVGLLLDTIGNGRLRQRQTRFMSQEREEVHGFLEAVEAPSG